jgi:hypothetical protein
MPRRFLRGAVVSGAFLVAAACSTKGSDGTDTASGASQIAANDSARAKDSAARAAPDTAWRSLVDGDSLTAWRAYRGTAVHPQWQAKDGVLTVAGKGGDAGDIITKDQFGDFELELEWKVPRGGNSGIFYRAAETAERVYETAPEYQVLDDARHPDGKFPLTSAGAAYGLYAPPRGVVKPAGEWNAARIVARGSHVEHWLNGQKVVDYELGSADWSAKVQASKFKDWPGYGKSARGHIGLQDHGDTVSFRNIRIRELQ